MSDTWFQLLYLLTAGAVVLLGARWELRRHRWGETAWRVLLVLLIGAGLIGAAVLMARSDPPAPPPASGDAAHL